MTLLRGSEPVVLVIPGPVTGKGRPKFVKATGRTYTDAKTTLAENRIYLAWQDAGSPRLPDGPLWMRVEVLLARPQGHWRRDGTLSAAGERSQMPTKRPDLDNILKLASDALNGCAYRDDAQLVEVHGVKRWCNPGEDEQTRVHIGVRQFATAVETFRAAA